MVVVWGEEFRNYFLHYCLASLMAPGNIPTLCRPGDRFLIATTREDQAAMRRHRLVQEAERYISFEYFDLMHPLPGVAAVTHANRHLVPLLEWASTSRGYGVMLSPDVLVSNDLGKLIEAAIFEGTELLMLPTIRLAKGPLLRIMATSLGGGDASGEIIDLPTAALVNAAVHSLHPEILAAEWDSSHFGDYINSVWWRVGHENGILLHTFSFIPLLIDYNAVEKHDVSAALVSSTDGPYLARNFTPDRRVRVIDTANVAMVISWAPFDRATDGILRTKWLLKFPGLGEPLRGALLRLRYHYYIIECDDWLKRRLFSCPIRWRINGEEHVWVDAEDRARRILDRYVSDLAGEPEPSGRHRLWSSRLRLVDGCFATFVSFYQRQRQFTLVARSYLSVLRSAMTGDREAGSRVVRRIRKILGGR